MKILTGYLSAIAVIALGLAYGPAPAAAATVQTTGAGSAVTTAHRTATFDIFGSGDPGEPTTLLGYTEDQIIVSVDDTPFTTGVFNGTHYGQSGNFSVVSISAEDDIDIFAVEVKAFSGHANGGTLFWQAFRDGLETGSGSVADIDGYQDTNPGTVFGWSDILGFDELRLRVEENFFASNIIALDDVKLQALNPVPVPAALPLFLSGLLGLGVVARRRKLKTAAA